MKNQTCPECRKIMRIWALDARRITDPDLKRLCVKTAVLFGKDSQDGLACCHQVPGGSK